MQTRDFRDLLDPTVTEPRGLTARHPTTLLLNQPAEQHIQLSMIFPLRMVAQPTRRATTRVNHNFC
jgi:hypothetical protein